MSSAEVKRQGAPLLPCPSSFQHQPCLFLPHFLGPPGLFFVALIPSSCPPVSYPSSSQACSLPMGGLGKAEGGVVFLRTAVTGGGWVWDASFSLHTSASFRKAAPVAQGLAPFWQLGKFLSRNPLGEGSNQAGEGLPERPSLPGSLMEAAQPKSPGGLGGGTNKNCCRGQRSHSVFGAGQGSCAAADLGPLHTLPPPVPH